MENKTRINTFYDQLLKSRINKLKYIEFGVELRLIVLIHMVTYSLHNHFTKLVIIGHDCFHNYYKTLVLEAMT